MDFGSPNKSRTDRALLALQKKPAKSVLKSHSNDVPLSRKLSFAAIEAYPVCQGYEYPATDEQVEDLIQAGYECPQLQRRAGVVFSPNIAQSDQPISFGSFDKGILDQVSQPKPKAPVQSSNIDVLGCESLDPCSSLSVGLAEDNGPVEDDDPFGIAELVDDMAYRVWKCGRCLSLSHFQVDCVNDIRCRFCFHYGHVRKDCLAAKNKKIWVPKRVVSGQNCLDACATPSLDSFAVRSSQSFTETVSPPVPTNPPPPPPPLRLLQPAMANFELDPTRWVPLGHQIIDGRPTRLPRTFYTPSVAPPHRHDSICTGILMPPPPPAEEAAWREQVRLFIVQQLQRAVDDVQPCLFGLGFYRLRSPAARFALVDHGPYEIAPDVFVRFVNHDDRDNHRAVQGYRRGWLMFLGVHLDYRNEYDIANAVATFGKYHYWHHDDEVLERTLVYASFPSSALVPRDVVFGRYGDQGPVRESWTAPCYVLSADFADILPPDEDQMPANGNPHQMPGQMQQDNNIFVLPQYPELGWNEQVPPLPQSSHKSAQLSGFNGLDIIENCLGKIFSPGFGPIPPVEILMKKLLQWQGPNVAFSSVPAALGTSSLFHTVLLTDKKWNTYFNMHNVVSLDWLRDIVSGAACNKQCRQLLKKPLLQGQDNSEADFTFASPVILMKKRCGKRTRKQDTPLVDTLVGRSTRSSALKDGYMHKALPDTRATPCKRRKIQKKIDQEDEHPSKEVKQKRKQKERNRAEFASTSNICEVPPTPIPVMQKVGLALGMEATELTKEKFMAAPDDKAPSDVSND
ncbi:hypothetical protein ACQ4PT_068439 [Festuca glaucescens]